MQNRFGLKDFVFLVLLIAVIVSVWLSQWQEDRRWREINEVDGKVAGIERQLSMIERRLEEGVAARPVRGGGNTDEANDQRDADWARDDVEIKWQERPSYANDPRDHPDYTVGGTFTETFGAQSDKITPLVYTDVYGRRVIERVVEPLATYHPETLEIVGVLAEAWQLDPDGMWLRAKIWDDARFSDGEPVTAEDFKYTYEMMMDSEIDAERFRAVYGLITDVEVIDDKVVDFHFEAPMFINEIRALSVQVLPKHFYEQFTSSQFNQSTSLLMGSGPFKVRGLDPQNQWRPGRDDIVLQRNEQYWGPKPPLEEMRFKVIQDDLAQLTDYRNRQSDMIEPTARQFVRSEEDESFLEWSRAVKWFNIRNSYSFIGWNGASEPFSDARVRRAMTHLIDRERVLRNILDGMGEVATGPFNPRTDQANPDIDPLEYSLDRARELLAEAGWEPGDDGTLRNERGDRFSFTYTVPSAGDVWKRIGNYLRDQCARVGIRCEVEQVDWSIFRDRLDNRDFDAISMAWGASMPESDPYQIWHSSQIPGGGDNFISWDNERADELIEKGRRELDDEKRMEIWHELHSIIHEEQPYTFMIARPWRRFINRRVENVHTYLTGLETPEFFIPAPQ